MKKTRSLTYFMASFACAAVAGCSAAPLDEDVHVDTNPATLEEARTALDRIDELQHQNPELANRLLAELKPRLDELNGLVARVEVAPQHFVSFYETQPGVLGISERAPKGTASALRSVDLSLAPAELYRRLAKGADAPAALIAAHERAVAAKRVAEALHADDHPASIDVAASVPEDLVSRSDAGQVQQALTEADGRWWRDNVCFKGGDFRGCFPNWGGHGYAKANAKTSFFQVAPYSGNFVTVQFMYEGSPKFADAIFPGEHGSWWWHSDSYSDCCIICACGTYDYNRRAHRWDILNGQGDGYHWTHAFRWTCDGDFACARSP